MYQGLVNGLSMGMMLLGPTIIIIPIHLPVDLDFDTLQCLRYVQTNQSHWIPPNPSFLSPHSWPPSTHARWCHPLPTSVAAALPCPMHRNWPRSSTLTSLIHHLTSLLTVGHRVPPLEKMAIAQWVGDEEGVEVKERQHLCWSVSIFFEEMVCFNIAFMLPQHWISWTSTFYFYNFDISMPNVEYDYSNCWTCLL